jgi:hypothetical protein
MTLPFICLPLMPLLSPVNIFIIFLIIEDDWLKDARASEKSVSYCLVIRL